MNRAFLSLYLIIVISVVAIGWGIDQLWEAYTPHTPVTPYENHFFALVEDRIAALDETEREPELNRLAQRLNIEIALYTLDELAQSSLGEKIREGEVVTVFDENGKRIAYKLLADTGRVLSIIQPFPDPENDFVYEVLLVVFYLGIAVVVYFWVWPLSRDLKVLEKQTRNVGRDGVADRVQLSSRSHVSHLALAFNRMADRIRELIDSHKEMTYAVSHELRTPLARMKFALQMANDATDREKVNKQLNSIKKDVSEMDGLINELLTYAGFEQEDQSLDFKPGDLEALVKTLLETGERSDDVQISVENNLGVRPVYCEWYLMERALHNLIQNAKRYAKTRIKITISCSEENFLVEVEDDGPGIPIEERERIFNSFVRLRTETNKEKSGFGLGLAIVKRIMKWHHGEALAGHSQLGGARFALTWPVPPLNKTKIKK